MHLGHRAREHGTNRTVDVARHLHELHFFATLDRRLRFFNQLLVECFFQTVVLHIDMEARHISSDLRHRQQTAEIQATGFPMFDTLAHVEQVGTANHVVKLLDTQLRHDLAHFFCNKEEVVHHVLRLARELLAQRGVLRRHTDRAGVQVAFAHHDAAFDHEWCSGETKFICT